ncbi:hypothetical protein BU17DRAFT_83975 [Hysterangium stoloniferum]|nr:hypothetical protein BU17DRAFT_83975 [Hysterangium stoloniferum]
MTTHSLTVRRNAVASRGLLGDVPSPVADAPGQGHPNRNLNPSNPPTSTNDDLNLPPLTSKIDSVGQALPSVVSTLPSKVNSILTTVESIVSSHSSDPPSLTDGAPVLSSVIGSVTSGEVGNFNSLTSQVPNPSSPPILSSPAIISSFTLSDIPPLSTPSLSSVFPPPSTAVQSSINFPTSISQISSSALPPPSTSVQSSINFPTSISQISSSVFPPPSTAVQSSINFPASISQVSSGGFHSTVVTQSVTYPNPVSSASSNVRPTSQTSTQPATTTVSSVRSTTPSSLALPSQPSTVSQSPGMSSQIVHPSSSSTATPTSVPFTSSTMPVAYPSTSSTLPQTSTFVVSATPSTQERPSSTEPLGSAISITSISSGSTPSAVSPALPPTGFFDKPATVAGTFTTVGVVLVALAVGGLVLTRIRRVRGRIPGQGSNPLPTQDSDEEEGIGADPNHSMRQSNLQRHTRETEVSHQSTLPELEDTLPEDPDEGEFTPLINDYQALGITGVARSSWNRFPRSATLTSPVDPIDPFYEMPVTDSHDSPPLNSRSRPFSVPSPDIYITDPATRAATGWIIAGGAGLSPISEDNDREDLRDMLGYGTRPITTTTLTEKPHPSM